MAELSKKYPERFINVGVAESSMISMCAGLAMRGYKPFAYTIASFAIFRPFEMVRIDVAYQKFTRGYCWNGRRDCLFYFG